MKDERLAYSASANSAPPEGKCDGLAVWGGRLGACAGEVPPAWNQIQSSLPEARVRVGLCR